MMANKSLPKILTAAEVARYWKLDGSTVRHAIHDGRLPARKADGRTWLVEAADVVEWRGLPPEEPDDG